MSTSLVHGLAGRHRLDMISGQSAPSVLDAMALSGHVTCGIFLVGRRMRVAHRLALPILVANPEGVVRRVVGEVHATSLGSMCRIGWPTVNARR
jgi:hypothetical protein